MIQFAVSATEFGETEAEPVLRFFITQRRHRIDASTGAVMKTAHPSSTRLDFFKI